MSGTQKSAVRVGLAVCWIYAVVIGYVIRIIRDPVNFEYQQHRMQFIQEKGMSRSVLTPGLPQQCDADEKKKGEQEQQMQYKKQKEKED